MTRYSLHAPVVDNDGAPLDTLHDRLRAQLGEHFPGFTELHGEGYWGGDHAGREPVTVYVVDTDEPAAPEVLRNLALTIKRDARQDAVYLTAQPISVTLV